MLQSRLCASLLDCARLWIDAAEKCGSWCDVPSHIGRHRCAWLRLDGRDVRGCGRTFGTLVVSTCEPGPAITAARTGVCAAAGARLPGTHGCLWPQYAFPAFSAVVGRAALCVERRRSVGRRCSRRE